MKINIITRHTIANYGSILQTFALQHVLEHLPNKTIQAYIINYRRKDEHFYLQPLYKVQNTKWNHNYITRILYILVHCCMDSVTELRFCFFQKEILHLTSKYETLEALKKAPPTGDILCTGSDQVWGPIGKDSFDPAFFLDFGGMKQKKIAYAASFGSVDKIPQNTIKKYLLQYNSILVREDSAVRILHELGIKSNLVLDPTLLLNRTEWEHIFPYHGSTPDKYILIYQMKRNIDLDSYAEDLSHKTGLPIFRISPLVHHAFRNGKPVILPSLEKFIAYIRNATYLVTDSFHGTAFAINHSVQFMEFLPLGTWTRNQNLLQLFGLENRIAANFSIDYMIQNPINYAEIQEKLNVLRKTSLTLLIKQIDQV